MVTAGLLFKDSSVFIARRKATKRLGGKWEFPGGKLERGETPEASLKRELKEELEIDAVVGERLGESTYSYDFGVVKVLFFRIYWDGGKIHSRDHDEYGWVSLSALKGFDFVAADRPFVQRLAQGDVKISLE
jgi:8-oxo-dGTP diphosphatase